MTNLNFYNEEDVGSSSSNNDSRSTTKNTTTTTTTNINNSNNNDNNNNTCGSKYCKETNKCCCRKTIQCVILGDAKIGKTSLVVSYTTNGYPGEYVPTAYDRYSVNVKVDDQLINLELCDTAGRSEFDSLRVLSYLNGDVFLLCFSVASRSSFARLQHMWFTELKHKMMTSVAGGGRSKNFSPKKPLILVGTQCDLRTNLETIIKLEHIQNKGQMEAMVSEREAIEFSKEIQALTYIECSALTQRNLKLVFDTAILATLFRSPHLFLDEKLQATTVVLENYNTNCNNNNNSKTFSPFNRKIISGKEFNNLLMICGNNSKRHNKQDLTGCNGGESDCCSFYDKNNNNKWPNNVYNSKTAQFEFNNDPPQSHQYYQNLYHQHSSSEMVLLRSNRPPNNDCFLTPNSYVGGPGGRHVNILPMPDGGGHDQNILLRQDQEDNKIKNVWKKVMKFFS